VPRGLVIFLSIVAGIGIFGFWGLPYFKQKLFGESLQTRVNIISAIDSYDVEFKGKSVSRTVVDMEIFFPMGGAPENKNELTVTGEDGKPVTVNWQGPESKEDIPEKGLTKWTIRGYFEIMFRAGMLRNKYRDLCFIRLTDVKTEQ
jgi:hypothetical protein